MFPFADGSKPPGTLVFASKWAGYSCPEFDGKSLNIIDVPPSPKCDYFLLVTMFDSYCKSPRHPIMPFTLHLPSGKLT
jgi:hypothetical protein